MIRLPQTLAAWGLPAFKAVLTRELNGLGPGSLPLQQGLTANAYALDEPVELTLIAMSEAPTHILIRAGVFYQGITSGCNCADDPTAVEPQPEYCELTIVIDKASAETRVTLGAA